MATVRAPQALRCGWYNRGHVVSHAMPRPTPLSAHPQAAASVPPLRSPDACRSSEWQNCDVTRPVDGSAWSECEGCAAGCRTRRRIAAPTAVPCPGSHRRGVKNLRDVFRRNLVGHRAEKIPVVEGLEIEALDRKSVV